MYKCTRCGREYPEEEIKYKCPSCDSYMKIKREIKKPSFSGKGIEKYGEVLPIETDPVTLQEGSTPIYEANSFSHKYGVDEVLLKYEGMNPTGSFKDRGSAVAVTKALEYGYDSLCLASTGNMAASVSAYSAISRLRAKVFVPESTPLGKVSQVIVYGGELERVEGNFQDCMDRVWEEANRGCYLAQTGVNPYYLEGEKTLSYELTHQMNELPDIMIIPMGTGGLLTSTYWGFKEQKELGMIDKIPKLIGTQAKACSPIVDAFDEGHSWPKPPIGPTETLAESIHVKTTFNGHTAIEAMRETGGFGVQASDEKIIEGVLELGKEGVYGEPASALPLAALKTLLDPEEDKHVDLDQSIMLLVTGNGLKESELMAEKGIHE